MILTNIDRTNINEFEQKPLKNELIDVINVLDKETENKENVTTVTSVVNQSNNKLKPVNEVKKNFLKEREKRKYTKLMKKKEDLEEQLKRNNEQWNLLKPLFKKKKLVK